jgi:uncharacterized membrane protein (DUF373 family)
MNKILLYVQFLASFIIAECISMWGMFYTLKFPNLSTIKALGMALPFAWLDWFFMTIAIDLGHKHKLVTETQDIFLLIITQFAVILVMNKFYLKQPLTVSDMVAFGIILVAFAISYMNLISKAFGLPIPKKKEKDEDNSVNAISNETDVISG